ncbi:TetR family transcriptional regulator [Plasticicumulans acidivorans]|uniref:TetR family transcriptional regulator n=1 Tax=Plasticicumulans acidivorans TaxID=886464 RepID=A0A317MZ67_9GAMM|nr:TetR family transcriptional regulator [Plasticicumulans acidivorans]PWV65562.1 TetR family transcriptional regulator [Plasticicumulans acidivorans]
MARKTKAEAEQTRTLILDTAEKLFHEQGVSHTSLADIAQAAGLTRGAIYWHFQDKLDLFNAMHERIAMPFSETLEKLATLEDPLGALRIRCIEDLENLVDDEHLCRVLSVILHKCEYVAEMGQLCERFDSHVCKVMEAKEKVMYHAHQLGQLRRGLDPHLAAVALHNFMLGTISDWLFAPERHCSLRRDARVLVDIFFRGIAAAPLPD